MSSPKCCIGLKNGCGLPFKTSYQKMFPFMRSPACRLGDFVQWQSGRCCPESDSATSFFLCISSRISLYLIKDTPGFVSICADQTSPLANQKTDQTSKQSDALLNHTSSAAFALIQIKKIIKTFLCIILIQRWNNQENYWIV